MLMPKRCYSSATGYRYGFNGKENDNDVKGLGNQNDYGFRIYDPRLARFLSVDPLSKGYPWYTPYQFAGNKPINCIDLDGLEEKLAIYTYSKGKDGVEYSSYVQWDLEEHQQRPEWGNNGILTKYYIFNAETGKTEITEAYERQIEVKKKGFFNSLFGRSEWFPQIQVFGMGTGSLGDNADPSKPLISFNFGSDELFELLTVGRSNPKWYGPISKVDKYEEAAEFLNKLRKEASKQKTNGNNETKREPVVIREEQEGTWDYYYKDKNGNVTSEQTSERTLVFPGSDGAPDTIKKIKYTSPKPPKKDIPRKD